MEEQLLPFIDTILKEKSLSGMTSEVFNTLRRELAGELKAQIDKAIIYELSEEQADEFSSLMDLEDTTDEILQVFITRTGVDTISVIARTMAKFREFYLGSAK